MSITYLKGDATRPMQPEGVNGPMVIAHCCNDIGGWGAGFVLALSAMNPQPEEKYRLWANGKINGGAPMELGNVQLVRVSETTVVANMIGQKGVGKKNGVPPIRYRAISQCLNKVMGWTQRHGGSIHMPRIGSGLAGGDWGKIEEIILRCQKKNGDLPVFVYDLL